MDLDFSKTKKNLMKAFSLECQARSRYDIFSKIAKKEKFSIIENLFKYTAKQELQHAQVYYSLLSQFSGNKIEIEEQSYPVDVYNSTLDCLKASLNAENEEHDYIYKEFAEIAKSEGFEKISGVFLNVAKIEKTHADRFNKIYNELKNGTLFKKAKKIKWMCTNCGMIHEDYEAPIKCVVCDHNQGYFMPFDEYFLD